ncbi:Lipopolysaccharide-assembly [Epsilonproteobacteria bacterium SCGC AD-308-P11]|nr:Lipopolysaccharide-assembly [Epsilonproteobacteria bacterium SCGC AD-308-P11]
MNKFAHYIKSLLLIVIIVSMSGCGYQPSSKFSRNILGEKISTSIVISLQDPENTVIIKDAVDRAIIEVFHASLVDRASSDTHLILAIQSTSYTPIQYNTDGYIVSYRMTVALSVTKQHNNLSKNYSVSGSYDFSVQPNAVVSDLERFDAIRRSSKKAIESFISKVSAEGARKSKVEE